MIVKLPIIIFYLSFYPFFCKDTTWQRPPCHVWANTDTLGADRAFIVQISDRSWGNRALNVRDILFRFIAVDDGVCRSRSLSFT